MLQYVRSLSGLFSGLVPCLLLPVLAAEPSAAQFVSVHRCAGGPASLKACASIRVRTTPRTDGGTEVTVQVRSWEGTQVRYAQEHWVGITNLSFEGAPGDLGSVDLSTFRVEAIGGATVPTTRVCKDPSCHDIADPSWRIYEAADGSRISLFGGDNGVWGCNGAQGGLGSRPAATTCRDAWVQFTFVTDASWSFAEHQLSRMTVFNSSFRSGGTGPNCAERSECEDFVPPTRFLRDTSSRIRPE